MWNHRMTIEEIDDPARSAEQIGQMGQFARNSRWLEEHWAELLPQACGQFVAVAGQQAFLANSADEAWAWAARIHPEDQAPLVQYVKPSNGPRCYAHLWRLAAMQ